MQEALHIARLALLEGALCALLRESRFGEDPNDQPDGISVHLTDEGIDIVYTRAGVPVGGEGM